MADAELKQIALRKNSKGIATSEALAAQNELWQRVHWEVEPVWDEDGDIARERRKNNAKDWNEGDFEEVSK